VYSNGNSAIGTWTYTSSLGAASLTIYENTTTYTMSFGFNDAATTLNVNILDANGVTTWNCGSNTASKGGIGYYVNSNNVQPSASPQYNYPFMSSNLCLYYATFDDTYIYVSTSVTGALVTQNNAAGLPGMELSVSDVFTPAPSLITYCDSCNSDKIVYALAPLTAILAITTFATAFKM